jgi:murein DD-endopeptidase MepM/ murein hydrolase activator NlpD
MNPTPRNRPMLALVIAVLFLALLACSVTSQPPVQTAVANAGQTALAAGEKAAGTEAAHLVETAKVAAATKAVELFATAQNAGATAAYSALETIVAGSSQLGSNGFPMFHAPVSGADITIIDNSATHTGPDLYARDYFMSVEGASVYPTLAGVVVYSGCDDPDYGCAVVLRHQNPAWNDIYYSVYAHLQTTGLVANGTIVDGNSPIGLVGQTGSSSGNGSTYLHFAVRISNQLEDGLTALYGNGAMTPFDFRPYMP